MNSGKGVSEEKRIWELLENVKDPEIPVLSVIDMGIVRSVAKKDNSGWEIKITPTYTGGPAMDMIKLEIETLLKNEGYRDVQVQLVLSPAWTTEWLSEEGRKKLKEYGIAPPVGSPDKGTLFGEGKIVPCPLCDSKNTELISQFGSTPCKALYRCNECKEPFDYFKCH